MFSFPYYFSVPEFKPYQQRVINRVNQPDGPHGIIAYHSMGSGKTLTSLGAMDRALKEHPGQRGLFVVPASLVDNVYKEMDKHGFNDMRPRVDVMSYEKAARHAAELASRHYAMSVFDEAHRLRNTGTQRAKNLQQVIDNSGKVLMLTGTAGYNHPADMASLVNAINPDEGLPNGYNEFENVYVNRKDWTLRNKKDLSSRMQPYIDMYIRPVNDADYPAVDRRVVNVEMSPQQADLYRAVANKDVPPRLKYKMRKNLPMSLKESRMLNMYSTGVRQVSVSPMHHDIHATYQDSPKINVATSHMTELARNVPGFRGVAYSNFLDAGIRPYVESMRAQGITPLILTGSMSQKQKKQVVDAYNEKTRDPRVLVISSSGGEGLDLKRTNLLQILDPHFNSAKLAQVESRAVRYKSHADLPKNQQRVVIEEYRSLLPRTMWQAMTFNPADTSIDTKLSDLAARKQSVINQMDSMMMGAQAGILR